MIATIETTKHVENQYGYCECGCGDKAPLAKRSENGHRRGDPMRYVRGHNRRGMTGTTGPKPAISKKRLAQIELDLKIDDARLDRLNWQRAVDQNLHALQDYVHPHQLIIWRPGEAKASNIRKGNRAIEVQLTTTTSCTCSRFKLRDRCEHIAFAKQLEASGTVPGLDKSVAAREVK